MSRHVFWSMVMMMIGLSGLFVTATADIPDLSHCYATTAADQPASVYVLPSGEGDALTASYAFGGVRIDATITVVMLDWNDNPIFNYPPEDIWLQDECCLALCPGGSIADGPTDVDGVTTISGPFQAGASTQAESSGAMVFINGDALDQPPFEITFNSPDINGDLAVNISDVVDFVNDYLLEYRYRSDYHWDGVINLSDLIFLAEALGASCP